MTATRENEGRSSIKERKKSPPGCEIVSIRNIMNVKSLRGKKGMDHGDTETYYIPKS